MAGCPGGSGIHISATGGTLTDSSAGEQSGRYRTVSRHNAGVRHLTQNMDAHQSCGCDQGGPADEVSGRYAVCAGVSALMPSVNLPLQSARGRVHFVASVEMSTMRFGVARGDEPSSKEIRDDACSNLDCRTRLLRRSRGAGARATADGPTHLYLHYVSHSESRCDPGEPRAVGRLHRPDRG